MIKTFTKYSARYTSRAARAATNVAKAVPGTAAKAARTTTTYLSEAAHGAAEEWNKEFRATESQAQRDAK